MKANNLSKTSIETKLDEPVEQLKKETHSQLLLKGKQDAEKADEITVTYFNASVEEFVSGKGQDAIDAINQAADSIINKDALADTEANTKKEVEKNKVTIHANQQEKQKLELLKGEIVLDSFKHRYYKYFIAAAIFIGVVDGFTSFNSLVFYFPFLNAIAIAVAITIVISVAHFAYCPWILYARTSTAKRIRIALVLILSFAAFYAIALIRVEATSSIIDLSVDSQQTVQTAPHLSPLTIALISFLMFLIVFGLSFKFHKSREEHDLETLFKNYIKQIRMLDNEIIMLTQRNNDLELYLQEQIRFYKHVTKYAGKAKQRAINAAENAIKGYKHSYTSARSMAPAFFASTRPRTYFDNFNSLN